MSDRINSIWDAISDALGGKKQEENVGISPMSNYSPMNTQGFTDPMDRPVIPMQEMVMSGQQFQRDPNSLSMQGMNAPSIAASNSDAAWNSQADQRNPVAEPNFLEKAGSGIKDYFGSEENMANLAIGLNSMRLNPDANLAALMGKKLERLGKTKGNNKTAEQLRKMGRSDLAEAVESGSMDGKTAWSLAHKAPSAFQEKLDFIEGKTPEEIQSYKDAGVLGGGGTTINMGDKTSMEFTKAGIADAKTQIASGYAADNSLRDIALLRKLGSNPILQEVPDMARGFIPQGYSPAIDAYNGQLDKVAKGLRQAGEGVMTEKDFEVLQQTSGAASMNIQAREILQSSLQETAKRQIERSSIAGQFMSQELSLSDYYAKMNELKNRPMFTTEQVDYLNSLQGMMGYDTLNATEKQSVPQKKWNMMTMQQKETFIKARGN